MDRQQSPNQSLPTPSGLPAVNGRILRSRLWLGVLSVLAAAMVQAADSQTAGQGQEESRTKLEEIIVTATRRAESLQDVPISVAAYTKDKMDVQGLRDVGDIANFTPGVSFAQSNDGLRTLNQRISIRGVSSSVGGATTGVYIDDTPIAIRTLRTNGDPNATAFPRLFDIDRVEVLRGPQGTLFGSGSEGGTVRFILPEPSMSGSSMYARAGVSTTKGGAPSWEAGVAGGAPIIEDKLGFRASIYTSQTGGYIDHGDYYTGKIDQQDYNWQKSFALQAAMKWLVTDHFTISPLFYHQQVNANGADSFYLPDDYRGVDTTSPAFATYYNRYDGKYQGYYGHFGAGAGPGNYVSSVRSIPSSAQYMDLYALNFKYALPKVDFIYNASLYETRQANHADFGWFTFGILPFYVGGGPVVFPSNPVPQSPEYDYNHNRTFTHEFRVQNSDPEARINWVAGIYVNDQKLDSHSDIDAPDWGLILPDAIPGFNPSMPPFSVFCPTLSTCSFPWVYMYQGRYPIWLDTQGWDKERAIFGQVDFKLTNHLQATLGLRYSHMSFRSVLGSAGVVDFAYNTEDKTTKTNMTTPKFGLKWTFNEGQMVYATVAKGGRNGGVNQTIQDQSCLTRLATVWGLPNGAPTSYAPDTVWSRELGSKFQISNKFNVDIALYQIDWNNMIRNVGIGGQQCFFSFTTNMGKARSRGAELAVQYNPVDSVQLSLTAGHAKVESNSTIYVPDPNDPTGISHTPDGKLRYVTRSGAVLDGSNTTVNVGAQYSFTTFSRPSYARVDFRYVGTPSKGDAWDPNSAQYAGAFNLFETPTLKTVNLRVGTRVSDWDVSLYVNNLTDTQPIMRNRMNSAGFDPMTNVYTGGATGSPDSAWMTGGVMVRPREMGVTAIYRY